MHQETVIINKYCRGHNEEDDQRTPGGDIWKKRNGQQVSGSGSAQDITQ